MAYDRLPERDIALLRENKLEPVGLIEVSIDDLYIQESFFVDMKDLFIDKTDKVNWHVKNSPIYEFLTLYRNNGWRYLSKGMARTRYYEMKRRVLEFNHRNKTKGFSFWKRFLKNMIFFLFKKRRLRKSIRRLINTYDSIKENRYLGGDFANYYITVLKKPFIVTKFGQKRVWKPYTIWSGHHRAAILAVLGYKNCRALLLKDTLE